ncbi:resolvase [Marinobacterium aestuarii]|uniref:Resolvase n=1 Tax=Marinobacterium aestuarii TaxID=1821621 RepID=A0A1A9EVS5_9GAMM|nr:recombinase family protein [Marinobacterium aestuarii]ANG61985.1 resolvase [Marinobacterium aestuarii]
MSATVTEQHRAKPAYIYICQSTMGQVRFHQESTERQYGLREKAQALGWPPTAIRILDKDLGVSGAQMSGRDDFKRLIADVSMGQVGAVFALEASRLARSNLDWHRLIELCALTATLVIDEDGSYDPADFNDGLLLGLKGTLAQAELHFLRARLQGGKLNKAKKGELRFPLPVGLCYDDQGHIVLDPNEEVRGAVRLVFQLFHKTGSAYAVVQRFADLALRFPKRAYGGAWDGKLVWGRLSHSRVLGLLKNPSYAGTYVFGRYQSRRTVTPEGEVQQGSQAVPHADWLITLPDHHPGYISWQEYQDNQTRLAQNRTNREARVLSGPAREGMALLQGLLLCGCCGRKLTVRYRGNGGRYPAYECNWRRREGLATAACMTLRCEALDTAIAAQVLSALRPAQLTLAVSALEQLEERDAAALRQWEMRLERAAYEAQLAERRYQEVDPSNRLVAATLEQRWNAALEQLEALKAQYAEQQRCEARVATAEQKAKVLALAQDFPRLWRAPTTSAKDRKRLLRLLIKDITVERARGEPQALLHVRWQGGACTDVVVTLPSKIADRLRYGAETVERVRVLAQTLSDVDIAQCLNEEGLLSAKDKPFTAAMISWIRYRYAITHPDLKRPEELSVKQVADRFGVSIHVVHYWIQHAVIKARQLRRGAPYWIVLNPQQENELETWVRHSAKIKKGEGMQKPTAGGAL